MKRTQIYISVLILSVVGLLILEWARPKPVDWAESYSGFDKGPYGSFILRDLLPHLFPQQPLSYRNKPLVMYSSDSLKHQNIIFINSSFSPDSIATGQLLKRVAAGKNIFIAARNIQGELADTLNIDIDFPGNFMGLIASGQIKKDSIGFNFTNKALSNQKLWYYFEATGAFYFSSFDTLNASVLGSNTRGEANYIKIEHGKGAFYLHTVPFVFTNFYMRKLKKAKYAFKVLSYLPVAPTIWDEYYKAGRTVNTSPLRYIVSQHYLRWAWFTTLISILLFFVFKAKRKQRVIPELKRLENTTLEFATTIGRLYHQNSSHKEIASKRIKYLMEYIREHLNLEKQQVDEQFITHISRRSGVDFEIVKQLFSTVSTIQKKSAINGNDLWQLNNQIELFYNQTSR